MNPMVSHLASGDAFFSGAGLLLATSAMGLSSRKWLKRSAPLVGIAGGLAILLSATPISPFYYGALGLAATAWLTVLWRDRSTRRQTGIAGLALTFLAAAGTACEIPYRSMPRLPRSSASAVTIFADSLTAGIGEGAVETWPQILAREHGIDIVDHSKMGETVSSALRKSEAVVVPPGIVIVELGGNDLFGSTGAAAFERDLDRLLERLSGDGRLVVMFESPLPPFCNAFGRAQRKLSSKYQAALIPKRVLMGVLSGEAATVDSLHLSQAGQRALANAIWPLLADAMRE